MSEIETGVFLGKIPYTKAGTGPRQVVVFNGGNAFFRRPDPARARRDFNRIRKVLPPDCTFHILGYEASPPADYDLDMIVRDFAAIMRERIGRATIIGISFGGFVASRLAAREPELVESLILMISAHRFSAEGRSKVERQIDYVRRGDFAGLMNEFAVLFRRPWFNWLIRLRLWTEARRLDARMNSPEAIARSLRATLTDDSSPGWLAGIRAPTLVVGGTRDQFFDVAAFRETAEAIPGARLELFDGETHMLPVERAKEVRAVLAAFLHEHGQPGGDPAELAPPSSGR